MRRWITGLAVGVALAACVCFAAPRAYVLSTAMGDSINVTNTYGGDSGVSGWVEEIVVSPSSGTGQVEVAYIPADGYAAAVIMATNNVTTTLTVRPRPYRTDSGGVSDTNQPTRYALCNEQVRVIVMGATTGTTWYTTIKVEQ